MHNLLRFFGECLVESKPDKKRIEINITHVKFTSLLCAILNHKYSFQEFNSFILQLVSTKLLIKSTASASHDNQWFFYQRKLCKGVIRHFHPTWLLCVSHSKSIWWLASAIAAKGTLNERFLLFEYLFFPPTVLACFLYIKPFILVQKLAICQRNCQWCIVL